LLDEISNVPPDGEASGPEAAGETPLCSGQETARSGSSNQAHMQLCWSSTQNKFVLICQRLSFNNIYIYIFILALKVVHLKSDGDGSSSNETFDSGRATMMGDD
jgi:hypothetical protein